MNGECQVSLKVGDWSVTVTGTHKGIVGIRFGLTRKQDRRRAPSWMQPLISQGTLADTLLFNAEALDLLITTGAPLEWVKLSLEAERILGGTAETKIFSPGPAAQCAGDAVIDVEEMLLAGVHDYTGGANIIAREY